MNHNTISLLETAINEDPENETIRTHLQNARHASCHGRVYHLSSEQIRSYNNAPCRADRLSRRTRFRRTVEQHRTAIQVSSHAGS